MSLRRRQLGISLIELMISITIGLGLLAALTTVFVNSSRSQAELTRAAQQIENGRFAIQTLQDDVWHAGFYGRHIAYTTTAPVALPDACSTNLDTAVAAPTPVQNSLAFAVQGWKFAETGNWTMVQAPRHRPRLFDRNTDWSQYFDRAGEHPGVAAALAGRAERAQRLNDYLLRHDLVAPR